MTQDDVIRLARKAGIAQHGLGWTCWEGQLEAFAKLVAAHEQEACAKECEHTALRMGSEWMAAAHHCAAAIRARGEQA